MLGDVQMSVHNDGPAAAGAGFPPVGFLDRHGAAEFLGIGTSTLCLWIRQGRWGYAGTFAPGATRCEQRRAPGSHERACGRKWR